MQSHLAFLDSGWSSPPLPCPSQGQLAQQPEQGRSQVHEKDERLHLAAGTAVTLSQPKEERGSGKQTPPPQRTGLTPSSLSLAHKAAPICDPPNSLDFSSNNSQCSSSCPPISIFCFSLLPLCLLSLVSFACNVYRFSSGQEETLKVLNIWSFSPEVGLYTWCFSWDEGASPCSW